ncbi:MAG: hypothetical protein GY703_22510 [Gammaproteobacteria bacterium]|nr:hypothetical protein [Gammaproteobacteria bacterium]
MRTVIIVLGLLAVSFTAAGQEQEVTELYFPQQISAKKLLNYCASSGLTKSGRERQRYCAGFVSGVEESVRLLESRRPDGGNPLCVPEGTSARKLVDSFMKYSLARKQGLDQPAVVEVIDALQSGYPCPGE